MSGRSSSTGVRVRVSRSWQPVWRTRGRTASSCGWTTSIRARTACHGGPITSVPRCWRRDSTGVQDGGDVGTGTPNVPRTGNTVESDRKLIVQGAGVLTQAVRALADGGIWVTADDVELKERALRRDGELYRPPGTNGQRRNRPSSLDICRSQTRSLSSRRQRADGRSRGRVGLGDGSAIDPVPRRVHLNRTRVPLLWRRSVIDLSVS